MLKLALICTLFLLAYPASAQIWDDQDKIDLGAGYAWPTKGFGVKPGFTFVAEPHHFVSKNFAMGARFEGAFLGYRARYYDELYSFFGSSCITAEVYFARKGFRPFIGAGGGLFTRHYVFESYDYDGYYSAAGFGTIKFGAFGRVGFEIGPVRLSGSYNMIGNNFSYASFTLGYVASY